MSLTGKILCDAFLKRIEKEKEMGWELHALIKPFLKKYKAAYHTTVDYPDNISFTITVGWEIFDDSEKKKDE